KLFQGSNIVPITSQEIIITATRATFNNVVEISNLTVDISSEINNILMSFAENPAYNNSHQIPYIVNNLPPVLKVFDSYGNLVETIELQVDYDYFDSINYTDEQNAYSTKSPTGTTNIDRNDAGGSGSMILSPATASVLNRNLGGGGSYATGWYSPFLAATIDYGSSENWTNFNNALAQNDSYASSYLATTGGPGQHSMPVENDFNESVIFGDLEDIDNINTTIDSQFTAGGSGSGSFGYTSTSGQKQTVTKNNKQGTVFTLSESGTVSVTNIWAYAKLGGGAKNPKVAKAVIYEAPGGTPTTLKGVSEELTLNTLQWWNFTFTGGVSLSPGDYWLGLIVGTKVDMYAVYDTGYDILYRADSYPDPDTSFGTPSTTADYKLSIYAEYEIGGVPDSNDINVEVEWSVTDPFSMDYLYWDYFSSTSISFSVYNYISLEFEEKTSSPFTLTTNYFNNISGTCTVKVRFTGTNPSSSFTLDIDQLRVNYTIPIVPSNTDWLRLTDFRLNIPTEAESIDGIIVEIDRYAQNSNSIRDKSIRLRLTSGPVGDDAKTASWWDIIDDDVNNTYGALDDDWNAGLSVSDINNIDFGIDISAENIGSNNTAFTDHVRIKVYYTMPGTSAEDWINPNKAKLQDNDYANVTFSPTSEDTSDWIRLTNFEFDIPTSGVTINGIEVLFDRQANVSGSIHDLGLYLRNSTGQATGNYANSLISWDILDDNGYNLYGNSTDLWGVSWSATEINLNTFGLDLYIEYNGTAFTNATVDDVQIKVYYTQSPQDQISWTNPEKVSAQDDDETFVSFSTSTERSSDWLNLTNFGFDIPLAADIKGIKVEIDQRATVAASITDGELFLLKNGVQIGDDMANSTAWGVP
ncbi:hypothetical protein LCGC14_1837980, partial [marine sediment metagenome]